MKSGLRNIPIMMVVLDLDDANVKILYSATTMYLSKDILNPGLKLCTIIRILRTDLPKILVGRYGLYPNSFVSILFILLPHGGFCPLV